MKLKPEVKRLWLDALRSGDYKQGNGSLRSNGPGEEKSYCCLGVLCDVAAKNGIIEGEWNMTNYFVAKIDEKNVMSCSYPTHHVLPIFFEDAPEPKFDSDGFSYVDPEAKVGKLKKKLSELNDDGIPDRRYKGGIRPFGFKEIADIIEEQL